MICVISLSLSLFLTAHAVYGSSQVRDLIWATAATEPQQWQRWTLNSLSHLATMSSLFCQYSQKFVNFNHLFKDLVLCFTNFLYYFSAFILLISAFIFIIFYLLLALGLFFFSRFLKWELRLLTWYFLSSLMCTLHAIIFPLTTDLVVVHKFWYAIFSFSFNSLHCYSPWEFFFEPQIILKGVFSL